MSTLPSILDILILRIKDRHHACPEVNCIVHSTSILYGIRIIISLIMHSNNSPNRQRLLLGIQQSPAYLKLFRFHIVLVRMEFARIQGRNPFVRNIYRGGQGNYESPFQDKDILSFYFYFCNSTLGHPRWTAII